MEDTTHVIFISNTKHFESDEESSLVYRIDLESQQLSLLFRIKQIVNSQVEVLRQLFYSSYLIQSLDGQRQFIPPGNDVINCVAESQNQNYVVTCLNSGTLLMTQNFSVIDQIPLQLVSICVSSISLLDEFIAVDVGFNTYQLQIKQNKIKVKPLNQLRFVQLAGYYDVSNSLQLIFSQGLYHTYGAHIIYVNHSVRANGTVIQCQNLDTAQTEFFYPTQANAIRTAIANPYLFEADELFFDMIAFADALGAVTVSFGGTQVQAKRLFTVQTQMRVQNICFNFQELPDSAADGIWVTRYNNLLDGDDRLQDVQVSKTCKLFVFGTTQITKGREILETDGFLVVEFQLDDAMSLLLATKYIEDDGFSYVEVQPKVYEQDKPAQQPLGMFDDADDEETFSAEEIEEADEDEFAEADVHDVHDVQESWIDQLARVFYDKKLNEALKVQMDKLAAKWQKQAQIEEVLGIGEDSNQVTQKEAEQKLAEKEEPNQQTNTITHFSLFKQLSPTKSKQRQSATQSFTFADQSQLVCSQIYADQTLCQIQSGETRFLFQRMPDFVIKTPQFIVIIAEDVAFFFDEFGAKIRKIDLPSEFKVVAEREAYHVRSKQYLLKNDDFIFVCASHLTFANGFSTHIESKIFPDASYYCHEDIISITHGSRIMAAKFDKKQSVNIQFTCLIDLQAFGIIPEEATRILLDSTRVNQLILDRAVKNGCFICHDVFQSLQQDIKHITMQQINGLLIIFGRKEAAIFGPSEILEAALQERERNQ